MKKIFAVFDKRKLLLIKKHKIEIFLIVLSLIFSFWLMFASFSYSDGYMLISSKAWSDFASHIPLIRSFSFGSNFPLQYPLFPGEIIRYHFLFYFFVGLLEKTGIRIDYALNILSSVSFALLIFSIYLLSKNIFKNKIIGILSVIFFLFNSSFSFLEFFKENPLSVNTLNSIINNKTFPSFGPYDGKIVSAFWNLNIYTNQRHLALPLALFLISIIFLIRENKKISKRTITFIGIFIGILSFLNTSVFVMTIAVFSLFFVCFKEKRKSIFSILLIGLVLSFPRTLLLREAQGLKIEINPGYLISDKLTLTNFITYWFYNLGLSLFLIPLGFILSSKFQKKLLLSFFSLFLIGNIFKFSPEMAANHKFFNVFVIIGNMFTSFALYKMWDMNLKTKIIVPFLFFLLILSGLIDFFPIKNDSFITIKDYPIDSSISWIMRNTPPDSVFLNSSYLYNSASLAGRKIFLGWPYFAWSLGYDTNSRDLERKELLNPHDLNVFCNKIQKYNLDYVIIQPTDKENINYIFFETKLKKVFENKEDGTKIYDIKKNC